MDLNKLLAKKNTTVHQQNVDGHMLTVKETAEYRWFEYGGQAVQSLMNLQNPEELVLPIPQSMLLFLLWKKAPLKVLNLGLGGAAFERTLATIPSVLLTSIEVSKPVLDIAKKYFKLPQKVHAQCQSAEQFIANTQAKYDVVLCDMFVEEKSPSFLFNEAFYQRLKTITLDKSVVLLNMYVETDEQLLLALHEIKKHFPYIALIDFDGYKNVVVVCSLNIIPPREELLKRFVQFNKINLSELKQIIPRIRYIPYKA
ncbi:spermidine synthase [Colwellia sp. RE-S-Sl-9]